MFFSKLALFLSWTSMLLLLPQGLLRAASSIDDLSGQISQDNSNPFCQMISTLDSSSYQTTAYASPPQSSFASSPSPTEKKPLSWLNFFETFFHLKIDPLESNFSPLPKVQLLTKTAPALKQPLTNEQEDIPLIQPISFLSVNNGEPLFAEAKRSSELQEYQIWVNNYHIASIKEENFAKIIQQRLDYFLSDPELDPYQIYPTLVNGQPGAKILNSHKTESESDTILFVINQQVVHDDVINKHLLAVQWVNHLRQALKAPPLDLLPAQLAMYNLEETKEIFEGTASWYGPYFHGRLTANGETYNQYGWTAAHPSLKLGTYLKITNLNNQKSMLLRINDRGPYIPPRTIDLSLGSAWCLDTIEAGVIPYRAVIMQPAS